MDIDFPLVLVVLTLSTGMIWLIDSVFWKAKRQASVDPSKDELSSEPWLIETSKSFFPVLAVVLVLRSFLVEPFQIPSGSMLPTLEVGDFILVNKFTYGLRLPVAGTKVVDLGDPQRGDVMVFKYPENPKINYIKRVVGLPGDVIRYENKMLYINDELVSETQLANLANVKLFEEQLGQIKHKMYEHKRIMSMDAQGEWTVPENSYFVMGDNRDNSKDSRYWGFVPDELIVGKAFAIWMQWKSLGSLPSFSRVGNIQ